MNREEIIRIVHETIGTILPGVPVTDITDDKRIKDLGADSVDRVEIVLSLIDRLELDEPMASFSDLHNVGALIDFLREKKGC